MNQNLPQPEISRDSPVTFPDWLILLGVWAYIEILNGSDDVLIHRLFAISVHFIAGTVYEELASSAQNYFWSDLFHRAQAFNIANPPAWVQMGRGFFNGRHTSFHTSFSRERRSNLLQQVYQISNQFSSSYHSSFTQQSYHYSADPIIPTYTPYNPSEVDTLIVQPHNNISAPNGHQVSTQAFFEGYAGTQPPAATAAPYVAAAADDGLGPLVEVVARAADRAALATAKAVRRIERAQRIGLGAPPERTRGER